RLEFLLHFRRHLLHALHDFAEAGGGFGENALHLRESIIVGRRERFTSTGALFLRRLTNQLVLLLDGLHALIAGLRDQSSDFAGSVGRGLQRLIQDRGEARQPLPELLGAGVERGNQRLDSRLPLRDRFLGAAIAALHQRHSISKGATMRIELVGEFGEVAQHLAGDRVEIAEVLFHLDVVAPVLLLRSVIAATNSDTRVAIVCSIELIFSWAPLSTSCSRIFASRRRSNRAVESERSIVCVSIISATVAAAVCLDCSIAPIVARCNPSSERTMLDVAASVTP